MAERLERQDQRGPRADTLAIVPMAVAGAIWGVLYVLAGVPGAAIWPWAYTVLAAANLWGYLRHGLTRALDLQLLLSLVIPWALMIDLGGFQASGAVMIWSLIAPVGALLAYGFRRSVGWFAAYAALALVAALLEGRLAAATTPPSSGWISVFYFMNVIGITFTAWLATARYAHQRAVLEAAEREARLQAEEATRAKSEFLANMSHELRTPMNAVIGMSSLLATTDLDEEQGEYLGAVRSSAEVLLATINDVLDYSKVEAGRLEIERREVELRPLIESTLDVIAPLASQKRLQLVYHVHDDVPAAVVTDGHRLGQVLVNLLTNGVKFTDEGEVGLLVGYEAADAGVGTVTFQVHDTGIGIPAEARSRLFRSFSQVDASTSRRFGGTGLGLAISQHIVELLGGRIGVDSEVGVGSRFSFSIPAIEPDDAPLAAAESPDDLLENRTVLIADANPTDQRLLEGFVRAWGMQPVTACTVEEALTAADDESPFDVALVDQAVDGQGGRQLAARLAEHPTASRAPRVLLTMLGSGDAQTERPLFVQCVSKPVKQSSLLDALAAALSEHSTRAARAPQSPSLDPQFAQQHPLRILIAEDYPTNQRLMMKLLERLGYEPDLARDGQEAVDRAVSGFDVVLMDVQMPTLDGLEATRRIRSLPVPQPWIIAVTANTMDEDRTTCHEAGMDDYLGKPVRPEALVAALHGAFEQRHPDRQEAPGASSEAVVDAPADSGGEAVSFDVGALGRLVELTGDRQFVESLLAELPREVDDLLARIREAHPRRLAEVRRHAHSLKSSAANLGATALAASASRLEAAAAAGDQQVVDDLIIQLDAVAAATVQALGRLDGW